MKSSIINYIDSSKIQKEYNTAETLLRISYTNQNGEYFLLSKEWSIWSKCFGKVFVFNGVSSAGKTTIINYLSKFGFNKVSLDDIMIDFIFNLKTDEDHEILFTQKCLAQNFLAPSDLSKIYSGLKINKDKYPSEYQKRVIEKLETNNPTILESQFLPSKIENTIRKINDAIWYKTLKSISSGENVIIDTVIPSNQELGKFSYDLRYYPISVVLVYSSLAENLKKCFSRNYFSLENDLCDYRLPVNIIYKYLLFYTFTVNKHKEEIVFDKPIKFLEKVNLNKTLDTLKEAQEHSIFLLKTVYNQDNPNYLNRTDKLKELTEKVAKILHNSQEVFVLSSVKFDHLIETDHLKMKDREYSFDAQQEILGVLEKMLGGEVNDFTD